MAAGNIPVGGSDFHRPQDDLLGAPTTLVEVSDDGDVLAGLAAGRVSLCADPGGPALVREGDEVIAVDAEGLAVVDPEGDSTPVTDAIVAFSNAAAGLHRLVDATGRVMALTP